jgi:hypothetical protein
MRDQPTTAGGTTCSAPGRHTVVRVPARCNTRACAIHSVALAQQCGVRSEVVLTLPSEPLKSVTETDSSFFISAIPQLVGGYRYVAASELSSRGGEARTT